MDFIQRLKEQWQERFALEFFLYVKLSHRPLIQEMKSFDYDFEAAEIFNPAYSK
jgi:hypothetical protein